MTPLVCSWAAAGDRGDGDVVDLHGLLEQAVEEEAALARAAAVEAEREFVEVEVELLRADRSLVGAEQPALEQRGNAVRARHHDVGRVAAGGDARRLMDEAGCGESAVALPAIGVDDSAGRDSAADEVAKDGAGAIADAGEPEPAAGAARTRLDRDRDDRPVGERAPSEPSRRGGADRGLVDFDLAGKPVSTRTHHRPAQLVQQRPGRLVAAPGRAAVAGRARSRRATAARPGAATR